MEENDEMTTAQVDSASKKTVLVVSPQALEYDGTHTYDGLLWRVTTHIDPDLRHAALPCGRRARYGFSYLWLMMAGEDALRRLTTTLEQQRTAGQRYTRTYIHSDGESIDDMTLLIDTVQEYRDSVTAIGCHCIFAWRDDGRERWYAARDHCAEAQKVDCREGHSIRTLVDELLRQR